ncbi:hypothetical protein HYFRA_00005642 [Hymenoscyphus fraxineus]|uniref:Uncharacterized protein n=1 Tax=Hymenoscyphus fraxineus TaxID=746836 RepID=A0A9N9KSF3_9HELO|nr:hypothetical protein HYFRA_00005642 [Hymenoscyphus fraxineus]
MWGTRELEAGKSVPTCDGEVDDCDEIEGPAGCTCDNVRDRIRFTLLIGGGEMSKEIRRILFLREEETSRQYSSRCEIGRGENRMGSSVKLPVTEWDRGDTSGEWGYRLVVEVEVLVFLSITVAESQTGTPEEACRGFGGFDASYRTTKKQARRGEKHGQWRGERYSSGSELYALDSVSSKRSQIPDTQELVSLGYRYFDSASWSTTSREHSLIRCLPLPSVDFKLQSPALVPTTRFPPTKNINPTIHPSHPPISSPPFTTLCLSAGAIPSVGDRQPHYAELGLFYFELIKLRMAIITINRSGLQIRPKTKPQLLSKDSTNPEVFKSSCKDSRPNIFSTSCPAFKRLNYDQSHDLLLIVLSSIAPINTPASEGSTSGTCSLGTFKLPSDLTQTISAKGI